MTDIERALAEYRKAIDSEETAKANEAYAEILVRRANDDLDEAKAKHEVAQGKTGAALRAIALVAQGVSGVYTDWNEQAKKVAALPAATTAPCRPWCSASGHDEKCIRYKRVA